jgi:hypothetical protein
MQRLGRIAEGAESGGETNVRAGCVNDCVRILCSKTFYPRGNPQTAGMAGFAVPRALCHLRP